MFNFFGYIRQRTCDAILAGVADAANRFDDPEERNEQHFAALVDRVVKIANEQQPVKAIAGKRGKP